MASPASRASRPKGPAPKPEATAQEDNGSVATAEGIAADLSYNEARAALDLILAELQTPDLNVEAMASLYHRAQAYAHRCEQILEQVDQDVLLWDLGTDADAAPTPYQP